MSQLLQQNDGPADTGTQRHHTHDSSKVARNHTYHSPNPTPLTLDAGQRSQRKPAPSPPQTSTTATLPNSSTTPTRSVFSDRRITGENTSPRSTSLLEEPRSPKERLNDLLASEKSYYTTGESNLGVILEENSSRFVLPGIDANGPSSRSISSPVLKSTLSGNSPSSTRPIMASKASVYRAEMTKGPPRTSSIDSAISSISGSTHSPKSSQDLKSASSPQDIARLIEAAGGAEALIGHLLKEKHSQNAQNAQLWRLVDKQRAMILGLNKDLDRTMRDKDKYKKKLKEVLAQPSNLSPVDSNQGLGSEIGSISSESRTVEMARADSVEAIVSVGLKEIEHEQQHSPVDVALASYPNTPPATYSRSPALSNMIEAEQKMPSPTQHAFQQFNSDATVHDFESGQQQRNDNEVIREVPYNARLPPSRTTLPSNSPRGPPPSIPPPKAPMSSQTPSVNLIKLSPTPEEGLRVFNPPRKAPPAPLNLGKQINASSHLRQASGAGDETESDYDDILEIDELPSFSVRGRRKTREEDEKEREMKEAEMRSLSKKSAQGASKSRPTTPKEAPSSFNQSLSPRQTIPISPPDANYRHLSPEASAGSLAGMLREALSGLSAPLMSPGLPLSPKPMDRPLGSPPPRHDSNTTVNSPPISPRGMGAFPGAVPLSPRAPRQAIPLPPNTPMSISSPEVLKGEPLQLVSPKALNIPSKKLVNVSSVNTKDENSPISSLVTPSNVIYKGLVTDEYPDLLLPPNALPSIDVRVASSRLKPSRASIMYPKNFEEDPVFTLAIFSRSDRMELWRVEKDSSSLSQLDQVLKQSPYFTAKTPERSLFSGHAPAKVDARRFALDKYLEEVLNTQMDMTSALELCRYLSTNTMEPHAEDIAPGGESSSESPVKTGPGGRPLRKGYLTKRGKNFGGWKARFFVLDGPAFKYYESPGGPNLGAIKLQNAQIGKQQQQSDHSPSRGDPDDAENQYRHAFLILEPKRKDSTSLVRHVLCAESDQERDLWVEALLRYVDFKENDEESHSQPRQQHSRTASNGSGKSIVGKPSAGKSSVGKPKKKTQNQLPRSQTMPDLVDDSLRGVSYETTKQGSYPVNSRMKNSDTPSPPAYGHEKDPLSQLSQNQPIKTISAPKNAQIIQDSAPWGNRQQHLLAPAYDDKMKQKKRSFFGFGTKNKNPYDTHEFHSSENTSSLSQMAYDKHGPIRPAFGASLGEAVRYNHPVDNSIELPAVIFRCIEYLDAKNACNEEGIFRLSGSNIVIKQLRERFNVEGDVNLVTDEQYYDVHAVASLLKLYLRELPTTILTRELHLEFLAVTELHDLQDKIKALNGLVYRLPRANNALLRYLSGFLINIINHADTNKMTVRNVGIVFSPTLNIPAPVFALFLQQYDGIFEEEPHEHNVEVTVTAPPLTPGDIRSPRRQKFQQDLPTPSYDQQYFPGHHPQQQQLRAGYDSGFTPLQPSYEQVSHPGLMAGPEYGRSAQTLGGPSYDQYGGNAGYSQGSKSKRRESTMFGTNTNGARKAGGNRLNDPRLVDDGLYFD